MKYLKKFESFNKLNKSKHLLRKKRCLAIIAETENDKYFDYVKQEDFKIGDTVLFENKRCIILNIDNGICLLDHGEYTDYHLLRCCMNLLKKIKYVYK